MSKIREVLVIARHYGVIDSDKIKADADAAIAELDAMQQELVALRTANQTRLALEGDRQEEAVDFAKEHASIPEFGELATITCRLKKALMSRGN